jgi:hypothetical protein
MIIAILKKSKRDETENEMLMQLIAKLPFFEEYL